MIDLQKFLEETFPDVTHVKYENIGFMSKLLEDKYNIVDVNLKEKLAEYYGIHLKNFQFITIYLVSGKIILVNPIHSIVKGSDIPIRAPVSRFKNEWMWAYDDLDTKLWLRNKEKIYFNLNELKNQNTISHFKL